MTRTLEFDVIGEQQIHCAGCEATIGMLFNPSGGG
jgi:hypothetical protein